jgi:hypothetical protein
MTDRQLTIRRPGFRACPAFAPGRSPGLQAGWRGRRPRAAGVTVRWRRLGAAILLGMALAGAMPPGTALAAPPLAQATTPTGGSLEAAASRAGDTGRKIGLSLIGLALSVAAVILIFKRDFKEAVGVVAIGIVAVLLVSPAGIDVLQSTVSLLFGSA